MGIHSLLLIFVNDLFNNPITFFTASGIALHAKYPQKLNLPYVNE